jgi:hypothetical protein
LHAIDCERYDGKYIETLSPGLYAFWKGTADARLVEVGMRETMVDVSGQDIMRSWRRSPPGAS